MMRNLLLLVLLGMGVVGCSPDGATRFMGCLDGQQVYYHKAAASDYSFIVFRVFSKDGKPIPCPEGK